MSHCFDRRVHCEFTWWELLKDYALQRLVRMALEKNLDLQIAAANIEEFQAQLMIAKFDLVPSLNSLLLMRIAFPVAVKKTCLDVRCRTFALSFNTSSQELEHLTAAYRCM